MLQAPGYSHLSLDHSHLPKDVVNLFDTVFKLILAYKHQELLMRKFRLLKQQRRLERCRKVAGESEEALCHIRYMHGQSAFTTPLESAQTFMCIRCFVPPLAEASKFRPRAGVCFSHSYNKN